ncbi:MAG: dipeptidase [Bryobacterales bacterium]|nr:dipeptidase [Bryobacterales bacterium]
MCYPSVVEQHSEYLEGLKAFLRIPSISTSVEHSNDVHKAAEFVRGELSQAGLDQVQLIEETGFPLVYGEWRHAPGKPTLLLYGHYDVQPADPLEEWVSPPFEPEIRDGNLYARGASDDKGQTYILIKAVNRLLRSTGRLPVNVRFLIEGEEESGGGHISRFVASQPPLLQADAALICDTEMFAPGLPTLCVGLRGIVYLEVEVTGARQDLHSGVYGGAAPNPLQAIAEIVCALKGPDGRIRIPGYYDRVRAPSAAEREAWSRLPFDEAAYREHEMGVTALVGEPDVPLFERLWARPTVEVHGIRGGFTAEGAKTVIPARATVKISSRLVADQDPDEAAAQLTEAILAACPAGYKAEVRVLHTGAPWLIEPENRFIRTAASALTEVFGRETVFIRSGGSIPIAGLFAQHLGIPSVLMGFGLPDDCIHSPNEKFLVANFFDGIRAVQRYLEVLGSEGQ